MSDKHRNFAGYQDLEFESSGLVGKWRKCYGHYSKPFPDQYASFCAGKKGIKEKVMPDSQVFYDNYGRENGFNRLENVVAKAHCICNNIMLFEAIFMEEDEVRLCLDRNHVSDHEIQNVYLKLVREYDEMTSSKKSSKEHGAIRRKEDVDIAVRLLLSLKAFPAEYDLLRFVSRFESTDFVRSKCQQKWQVVK